MTLLTMSVIRKIIVQQFGTNGRTAHLARHCSSGPKNILHSDMGTVQIPDTSVDQFVLSGVEKWPKRIAAECGVTGRKYSYEQIWMKSRNLARHLRKKLKLQKGDVIAMLLPNCPEFSLSLLGALKAGLTVTTVNPLYTPDEISRQINDSSTKAIITLVEFWEVANKSARLSGRDLPILLIKSQPSSSMPEKAIDFDEFVVDVDFADAPPCRPEDVAFLPYSSGTTGLPKGVELTHRNMLANLSQIEVLNIVRETTNEHQDIIPAVLPKFHIYGLLATTLYPLKKGTKIVDLPKFTPELYVDVLRKHQPHVLYVAPPIVLFLSGHPMVKMDDLMSVRTVVSGAAPLGALDEEKFQKKASKNINMLQGYGLTETSPLVTMATMEIKKLKTSSGSIGRPVPLTTLKIVNPEDPNAAPLGPNEKGELLIKGPQVMRGYHNRPKETAEAFTEDGWFRSGDMMYYNEDNILFITDRLKELIKVKGYQVPPAELEEIIRDYPDIADAAVIGVPHAAQGEVPRAYIVQKPNKNVDVNKLNEFVASKVAPYKRLKGGIEIIEQIPKNAAGKILRRELKLKYAHSSK